MNSQSAPTYVPYYEEGEWILACTKDKKWTPVRITHRTEGAGWIEPRSFACEDEHGERFEPIKFACPGISVIPYAFPSLANAKEAMDLISELSFELSNYLMPVASKVNFQNIAEAQQGFAKIICLTVHRRWSATCEGIEKSSQFGKLFNLLPEVYAMDTARSMDIDPDLFNL